MPATSSSGTLPCGHHWQSGCPVLMLQKERWASIKTVRSGKNGLGADQVRDESGDQHGRPASRVLRVETSGPRSFIVYLGAIRNYVESVRPGKPLPLCHNMTG